jgi:hypothetical protein
MIADLEGAVYPSLWSVVFKELISKSSHAKSTE